MSFALKKILCSLDLAKNARNLNSKICSCSLEFSSVFLIARKILARTRSARKLKFKNLARNSLGSKMPLLVLLELENFSLGLNTTIYSQNLPAQHLTQKVKNKMTECLQPEIP